MTAPPAGAGSHGRSGADSNDRRPLGPLRVLVVHNAYQQRGGEDAVVESEVELLRAHGHAVETYFRHNDELRSMSSASAAVETFWSRRSATALASLIEGFAPDIVHAHNTFPLVSPSVYWVARRYRIPVVQTLHNFRLVCPQGLMLRDGKPCEDCVGRTPWPAVRYACYRDSRAQTAVLSGMIVVHRAAGTWQRAVTTYIALNEFCRERFIAGGLPAGRIRVKPNFVDLPQGIDERREGYLFVGRLAPEKGVQVLAAAAREAMLAEPVAVAGSGPLADVVAGEPALHALGALGTASVYERMRRARALILPSIWYENFPRTIVEAFACGLPVIASRLGAMPHLVADGRTGLLFEPGDAHALAEKLRWADSHRDEMAAMGRAARRHFEAHLSADVNHAQLIDIYRESIVRVAQGS